TPRHFSFNSPYGACPRCHGIGQELIFDPELIVTDPEKSLNQGCIVPWKRGGRRLIAHYKMMLRNIAAHLKIDLDTPWKDIPEEKRKVILHGSGTEEVTFRYIRDKK